MAVRHYATPRRPTTRPRAARQGTDKEEARERKAAAQFKAGNKVNAQGANQHSRTVRPKSDEPFNRDFKAENSKTTIGKVAAGAGVSRYKAEGKLKPWRAVRRRCHAVLAR
jgi:hypothetical protein